MRNSSRIPVIDIFAGPGGLGEGFASCINARGHSRFRIALSIEMDEWAHSTLEMRAFFRQFPPEDVPAEYYQFLRGEHTRADLMSMAKFRIESRAARTEAWKARLGGEATTTVRERIASSLRASDPWVLIGGPPCQAYSLAGRSRNKGVLGYHPEADHRQTLYVEYLQVLADFGPSVFVLENVKGLLSATLAAEHLFERIRDDLSDPAAAIRRERRGQRRGASRPRYTLHALSDRSDLFGNVPGDFVVRAERHGIPQARHRVIIVGVREGTGLAPVLPLVTHAREVTVDEVLGDLPVLRSGMSTEPDSHARWREVLQETLKSSWLRALRENGNRTVADAIRRAVTALSDADPGRGRPFVRTRRSVAYRPDWYQDEFLHGTCNHESRSHMPMDLHRYLFAACFAQTTGRSPVLADFPVALRPAHSNVARALDGSLFADRFRVQLAHRPATTVTSHIAKDGHYYIHHDPQQCRSLTVREGARLQTFPDNYLFCGPRTAQYVQVGNAVPPMLAREIAAVVAHVLGA